MYIYVLSLCDPDDLMCYLSHLISLHIMKSRSHSKASHTHLTRGRIPCGGGYSTTSLTRTLFSILNGMLRGFWGTLREDPQECILSCGLGTISGIFRYASSNDFHNTNNPQSSLLEDAKMVCHQLYADKTQLSSFGTEKGYPIMARIANLPVKMRNGEGLRGSRVVGWLPIVCLQFTILQTTNRC